MFTEEYVAIWRHWVTAIGNLAPIPFMNFISGKGLSHTGQLINSHYNSVIMSEMVPQISSLMILCSTVIRTQIKENIKVPRHWPLWGNSPVTSVWPTQKASDAVKNSSWWSHHDPFMDIAQWFQTKNDDQLTSTKQCSGQVCILYDEA